MDGAGRVAIVGDGVVVGRAVVPDREIADLPMPSALELGLVLMLVEEGEEGVALGKFSL